MNFKIPMPLNERLFNVRHLKLASNIEKRICILWIVTLLFNKGVQNAVDSIVRLITNSAFNDFTKIILNTWEFYLLVLCTIYKCLILSHTWTLKFVYQEQQSQSVYKKFKAFMVQTNSRVKISLKSSKMCLFNNG